MVPTGVSVKLLFAVGLKSELVLQPTSVKTTGSSGEAVFSAPFWLDLPFPVTGESARELTFSFSTVTA